jgi:hypothetical protein
VASSRSRRIATDGSRSSSPTVCLDSGADGAD